MTMDFLMLTAIVVMIVMMTYIKMINLAKDRALKVINKIIQIKLQTLDLENLTSLICKTLQQDLKGKFAIILTDQQNTLIGGEEKLGEFYDTKIKLISNHHRLIIIKSGKILYYHPLSITTTSIGVLLVEVDMINDFLFGFRKILPLIANHISFILESFRTIILLNEVKMSEEREKVKSLILSSISHDLKTPLCSIIDGLGVFKALTKKQEISKTDQQILIASALFEAKRLNKFISDILEMTKIKSGVIAVNKKFISPRSMVEWVLQRFESKLKNYHLVISLSKKIKIHFDPVSFEQIIQNLIDNIIKYSAKNTRISIYEKINQDSYEVFIQDEGEGIGSAKIHLMFNQFERLNHQKKPNGNGLRLSIVKALMEVNNASISAENVTDKKGMVFILKFNDFQN